MIQIRMRYLVRKRDRHGKVRHWVRIGRRWKALPCGPEDDGFLAAYEAAKAALENPAPKLPSSPVAARPGSLRWLCAQYFASGKFRAELGPRTRYVRRQILERACRGDEGRDGDRSYRAMRPRHVRMLRDEMAGRPEAANGLVKALRQLFAWAISDEKATENPALQVEYLRGRAGGFHKWTEAEIEQYEERHQIGTKAHLALSLLLYTGGRRSDAVLFGRQMARGGMLRWTETKGRDRRPKERELPILPALQASIDAAEKGGVTSGNMTFLVTEFGKPFTANGFGNWFRKRCDEAGLPQCSAHGLRKAGATRAANNGASAHQLMAIFGWLTLKEAERYTREADRKRLAREGMHHLAAKREAN